MSDGSSNPACPECAKLRERVARLEAELRELKTLLRLNSSNSSTPPSADPPSAPKPTPKTPTGKKPGGQPGHPGSSRRRLPPEQIKAVVPYIPKACRSCGKPLPSEARPGDPEPTWHQVAELPPIAAEIVEHQGHARTCPCCGKVTRAEIPADIRAHTIGPRLTAVMSLLSGFCHDGKRTVQEMVQTVFAVPISLGSVCNREAEMSAALAEAHHEIGRSVQEAQVKNVDETGWSKAGSLCWLWTAATTTAAYFVIAMTRGRKGLRALLGRTSGVICSDRWSAYRRIPRRRRQVCWAHLKRDFQKWVDIGGAASAVGEAGLRACRQVFDIWRDYRRGFPDHKGLKIHLRSVRKELRAALETAGSCAHPKAAKFAAGVLKLYSSLWTFVRVEGVEPTNNHAERVLRAGVLWRKNAFGCHSLSGCRFAERMLTVVQTLRLQKRSVLGYLEAALIAHRSCLSAPQILIAA